MHCFACRLVFVFIFFIIRFGIDFDMKLMVRFCWIFMEFHLLVYNQKGGRRSDRDLWTSRNSNLYYGCSNASKKFPSAYLL